MIGSERIYNAQQNRILRAQGRDRTNLKMIKRHTNGKTIMEISHITGEPRTYLKNALRRMKDKGLFSNKLEINNNRTQFRWYYK